MLADSWVLGTDFSANNGLIDFEKTRSAGSRFSFHRASIGDYYTDPLLRPNYEGAREDPDYLFGCYLVVAPANLSGRTISAKAHVERFLSAVNGLEFDFPVCLDCELTRWRDSYTITNLILDIYGLLPTRYKYHGEWSNPPIYTRQSWWDYTILYREVWKWFPLFAARYSLTLTSPWSDGFYEFRDWDNWDFWQFSADGNNRGAEFGAESDDVDLDRFNGSYETLFRKCRPVKHKFYLPMVTG